MDKCKPLASGGHDAGVPGCGRGAGASTVSAVFEVVAGRRGGVESGAGLAKVPERGGAWQMLILPASSSEAF